MSDVILFDLDGTLTDSGLGITRCVQYALNYMGKPEHNPDNLKCFVGPPLHEQFMKYAGFTSEEADMAVAQYRERYTTIGMYENEVYEGIPELLQELKASGKILAVASSKPQVFVEDILRHFGMRDLFEVVVGSELDGTRTAKEEVIEEALKQLKCSVHREQVVMVGDRKYDVEGAGRCGLLCVGVAYGYGSREELESAGAVYIADTVADLKILMQSEEQEGEGAEAQEGKQQDEQVQEYKIKRKKSSKAKRSKRASISGNVGTILWDIFYPMLVHFGCMMFVSLLGVSMAGALFTNVGSDYLEVVKAYPWLTSVLSACTALLAIFFLKKVYLREKEQKNIQVIRWGWKEAVACGVLSIGLGLVWTKVIKVSGLQEIFSRYTEISQNSYENQNWFLLLICVGILASIGEELVFRGLIYQRAKSYFGVGWAIGISGTMFGLYHGNVVQFLYATVLGILFAVLYEKTGSFSAPVVAHVAANVFSISYDYIVDFFIKRVSWGEYLLLGVVIILALLGAYYLFFTHVEKKKIIDDDADTDSL